MFIGEYEGRIDSKGRVSIPSRMREVISQKYSERLILTRGLDNCLALYPADEWEKVAEILQQKLPVSTRVGRKLQRSFYRNALECTLDAQGRIILPPKLREAVQITKEVIITGVRNRIEIWSKEVLAIYDADFEESFLEESLEDLAERVEGIQF